MREPMVFNLDEGNGLSFSNFLAKKEEEEKEIEVDLYQQIDTQVQSYKRLWGCTFNEAYG